MAVLAPGLVAGLDCGMGTRLQVGPGKERGVVHAEDGGEVVCECRVADVDLDGWGLGDGEGGGLLGEG